MIILYGMLETMLSWLKRLINMSVYRGPATPTPTPTVTASSATWANTSISSSPTVTAPSATWANISISSSPTVVLSTSASINTALIIHNKVGGAVLTIHYDGRIEYTGTPSEASDAFLQSLEGYIDLKAAGTVALEKTYRRAIKRCLNQAKTMTHDDFIATLEKEVDSRTSKIVLNMLSED